MTNIPSLVGPSHGPTEGLHNRNKDVWGGIRGPLTLILYF